jgi:hypothetical protein
MSSRQLVEYVILDIEPLQQAGTGWGAGAGGGRCVWGAGVSCVGGRAQGLVAGGGRGVRAHPPHAHTQPKPQSRPRHVHGCRFALAEATVARASDFGRNDTTYYTRTHLGHVLHPGGCELPDCELWGVELGSVKGPRVMRQTLSHFV